MRAFFLDNALCTTFFYLVYQNNLILFSFHFSLSLLLFTFWETHISLRDLIYFSVHRCVCICVFGYIRSTCMDLEKKKTINKTYIHSKLKPPRQIRMLLVWLSFKNNHFILSKSIKSLIHKGLLRFRHWENNIFV